MDTNESLSLETFPKSYEACFLENCAVREDCLHHLYFKLQLASNTWGDAIFPSALMPENLSMVVVECFMQRDSSPVMQVSLISLTR